MSHEIQVSSTIMESCRSLSRTSDWRGVFQDGR
jgi:hypothetical protein